jgi:hypothetical protein
MIDEVRGLLDQYAQWVRDKSILRVVNDQYVEITTPYLDRHNDYTQIYVRKDDGGFVLTDAGDTKLGIIRGCASGSPLSWSAGSKQ